MIYDNLEINAKINQHDFDLFLFKYQTGDFIRLDNNLMTVIEIARKSPILFCFPLVRD